MESDLFFKSLFCDSNDDECLNAFGLWGTEHSVLRNILYIPRQSRILITLCCDHNFFSAVKYS